MFQKNKARQIFRKTNIERFAFLKYPFGDSLFCLITDELVFYSWSSQLLTWLFFSSLSFFLGLNFRFRMTFPVGSVSEKALYQFRHFADSLILPIIPSKYTAQKMKFPIKDFFSKCRQILNGNFIFVQNHNGEKLRWIHDTENNERNNILPCNMLRERNATFFTNNWIVSSLQTNNFFFLYY